MELKDRVMRPSEKAGNYLSAGNRWLFVLMDCATRMYDELLQLESRNRRHNNIVERQRDQA